MISPPHRAAVRNETIISVAINALIPTAIIRAIGFAPPQQLWGLGQLLHAMTMASGLATLLMSAIVTLLVRGRVRRRPDLALTTTDLPRIVRLLPRQLPARAPVMGLTAIILLVPAGAALSTLLHILPLGVARFVVFNLVFGTVAGLTMTPAVVLRALADPVAR